MKKVIVRGSNVVKPTINTPIIEIDVHGMTVDEAIRAIQGKVHAAATGVYKIRVIHGYHGGTRIRSAIFEEFRYGREPKVKRVEMGSNEGITELILKELF